MLIDARSVAAGTVLQADIAIVGSGVAGLTIALQLAAQGRDVLVLEAGGVKPEARQVQAQRGSTEGADHDALEHVSTRRLGGSLALWGGRLAPPDPDELVEPTPDGTRWPFSIDEILAHLQRAQQFLGGGRYDYRPASALADPADGAILGRLGGPLMEDKLWRWGPPVRYPALKPSLQGSARLTLIHHATVTRVRVGAGEPLASGLEIRTSVGGEMLAVARRYVLACGGLDTARLLLASHDHRVGGLGNENGLLGVGYMTHPSATLGTVQMAPATARSVCRFARTRDNIYARRILYVSPAVRRDQALPRMNFTFWNPDPHDPGHRSGVLSAYALGKAGFARAGLTDKLAGAHRAHLLRDVKLREHVRNIARSLPRTSVESASWAVRRWALQPSIPALLHAGPTGRVQIRFDAEQAPHAANRVELTAERDGNLMPRLRVRYTVPEADRAGYWRSLNLLAAELWRHQIAAVSLPREDEFMGMPLGDGTHQLGLTRMSTSPSRGVVDPDCRLHSCPNVYVVSCAVFPSSGTAPPTLTLVALAFRAAAHMIRAPRHDAPAA